MPRIANLLPWRRRRLEQDLDRELRYHVDRRIADLKRSGQTDEEARRVAEGPLNHLFRLFIPHAVPKDLNTLPADYAYYKEFFRPFVGAAMSYDDVINSGVLVVGSPKTVARRGFNKTVEQLLIYTPCRFQMQTMAMQLDLVIRKL